MKPCTILMCIKTNGLADLKVVDKEKTQFKMYEFLFNGYSRVDVWMSNCKILQGKFD